MASFNSEVFDHPLVNQRYFFPRKDSFKTPYIVATAYGELACYHSAPFKKAKTIIHFHGNGEVVSDYFGEYTEAVHKTGCNILLAEYRGYGMSSGKPAMAAMLDDAVAIVKSLESNPEDIILFGRSVGSIYAIHAASEIPGIGGLVIESGVAFPLERIQMRVSPSELGVSSDLMEKEASRVFNHARKIKSFDNPLLIMHTQHDGLVDVKNAHQLYDWSPSNEKTIRIFDYGDHNTIFFSNFTSYFQELQNFIARLGINC